MRRSRRRRSRSENRPPSSRQVPVLARGETKQIRARTLRHENHSRRRRGPSSSGRSIAVGRISPVRSHAARTGPSSHVPAAVPIPLPQARRNAPNLGGYPRRCAKAGVQRRTQKPQTCPRRRGAGTSMDEQDLGALPLRIRAIALTVATLDERCGSHSSRRYPRTAGWPASTRLRTPPCRQGRGHRVRFGVRSDGAPNRPARTAAPSPTWAEACAPWPRGTTLKRWVAGSYRSPVTFISRDRSKD